MKRLVQKLFVILILIFTLNISVVNSKSLEEIKLLPPDKIRELADTGDAEAQYWLGELIANGAIENWMDLSLYEYRKMAMEQDHPAATYRLYEQLRSGYRISDADQVFLSELVNSHLIKLANSGEARANWYLSQDLYDMVTEENRLFEGKARFHLEKAAELGLLEAIESLALDKRWSGEFTSALELYKKAYLVKPDEFTVDPEWRKCNILGDLKDFYDGSVYYYTGDEKIVFLDAVDKELYLETLKEGRKHSCLYLMTDLAWELILRYKEEDVMEAYIIASDVLSIAKGDKRLPFSASNAHIILGYAAHFFKDMDEARRQFSQLSPKHADTLFGDPFTVNEVCAAFGVSNSECRNFIFN